MSEPVPIEHMSEPRFLDEVGYFLYYEKEMRWDVPDYDEERRFYSGYHSLRKTVMFYLTRRLISRNSI